ncbi:hypothetical protein EDD22DRAFT_846599 [Suillus occidentalis]|nr:hypothetical protein EDD22DRAFT_846599 [Suillus occidentalis]
MTTSPSDEHISEVWTALASYEPSKDDYLALCRFIINCCRQKLSMRIFTYQKTWHTPAANELSETRWLDTPIWFSLIRLPPDENVPTRKQEFHAEEAQKMESDGESLGFKRAIGKVSDCCGALYHYVSWSAGVVKTMLTKTTLAFKFNGFTTGGDGDQDGEDKYTASLLTPTYSKIIRSRLSFSLLEIPHASSDIANFDDICEAYLNAASSKPVVAYKDLTKSILKPHPQTFTGTVHAETLLMGLLTYFSSSSNRVAFEMPPRDDHVVVPDKLLEPAITENVAGVVNAFAWSFCRPTTRGLNFRVQMASFIHGVLLVWEWISRFFRGWGTLYVKSYLKQSTRKGQVLIYYIFFALAQAISTDVLPSPLASDEYTNILDLVGAFKGKQKLPSSRQTPVILETSRCGE